MPAGMRPVFALATPSAAIFSTRVWPPATAGPQTFVSFRQSCGDGGKAPGGELRRRGLRFFIGCESFRRQPLHMLDRDRWKRDLPLLKLETQFLYHRVENG